MTSSTTTGDPLLIVGITIVILVMLVINVYALANYTHPEDKNESYLAKALVIFCMQLATMSVLMLPVDVANNAGSPSCDDTTSSSQYCGGINMYEMWQALFCMICFVVMYLIPYAAFYYEQGIDSGMGPPKRTIAKMGAACGYSMVIAFAFLLLLLVLYFTSDATKIPVDQVNISFEDMYQHSYSTEAGQSPYTFITMTIGSAEQTSSTQSTSHTSGAISYNVNFSIYVTGLFGWICNWLFSFFAGTGLTALPFDLICAFIWRPRTLAPDALATKEVELQERTNELLEVSTLLKRERMLINSGAASANEQRKRAIDDRIDVNRLTQMIFVLERDVEELQACKKAKEGFNPLIPYIKLIVGCFFGFLSMLWFFQMALYMLPDPPASGFLNKYFEWYSTWFPMFGDVSYAMFALYLLACTIKGCFKFGLRFMLCKIYPVKPGGTYVDAMLFNVAIILVNTIPLIQFCAMAFADFTASSDIYLIFGVQVENLSGFSAFYQNNVFTWFILLLMWFTLGYLLWRPRDAAASTEEFKSKLHRRGAASYSSDDVMKEFTRIAKTSIAKATGAPPPPPARDEVPGYDADPSSSQGRGGGASRGGGDRWRRGEEGGGGGGAAGGGGGGRARAAAPAGGGSRGRGGGSGDYIPPSVERSAPVPTRAAAPAGTGGKAPRPRGKYVPGSYASL